MTFITFIERVVVRVDDTRSPRNHQIAHQAQKIVNCYSSDVIPRVGEIVCMDNDKAYDVVAVIHCRRKRGGIARDEVFVEVTPHIRTHAYCTGSYSIVEEWPLVTELSDIQIEEAD